MGKKTDRIRGEAEAVNYLARRATEDRVDSVAMRNRRVTTALVRERVFLDDLKGVLRAVFPRGPVMPRRRRPGRPILFTRKQKDRIVNVNFSDLHYGSMLDARELPLAYGPKEEARRTAKVVAETCDYKPQYRDRSRLFVHLFGDLMQGSIHDPRDGSTITEQFGATLFLLTQAIHRFSAAFPDVTVRCVPGNHGRNPQRHPNRATNQKWDSFENMIYLALSFAVASLPNVRVEIPYTPYYTYRAFDRRGFVTHGDTVLDTGFPSETIDVKKIRNQINEWNAGDDTFDLFIVGHVHCGSIVPLPSGPVFMSNGCLVPPDGYAVSRGRARQQCGMWTWESVPGHIVGDARFVNVDKSTDSDRSLDAIIKPFQGLDTRSLISSGS